MTSLAEALVLLQRGVTILCGSINVLYFMGYRSPYSRRRVGAWILVLVNLAFVVEALYFGVLPRLLHLATLAVLLDPRLQLLAGTLPLLASLAITLAVARHWRHRRRR